MRIFLAGATGAVGRSLVPMLIEAGHEVVGTTWSAAKLEALASVGAEPVVMDGLDEGSVQRAVLDARPDVVIHQLTALNGSINTRKFDEEFALTNQLRTVTHRPPHGGGTIGRRAAVPCPEGWVPVYPSWREGFRRTCSERRIVGARAPPESGRRSNTPIFRGVRVWLVPSRCVRCRDSSGG